MSSGWTSKQRGGELALSIFGLEMFGGHADGEARHAEFSSYWGWGWGDDEPYEDLPSAALRMEVEEKSRARARRRQQRRRADGAGRRRDRWPQLRPDGDDDEYEEDHEDYCEAAHDGPRRLRLVRQQDPYTESMHGFIGHRVGRLLRSPEADFEALYLEDTRSDLGDDDLIVYTEPGAMKTSGSAPEKAEVD